MNTKLRLYVWTGFCPDWSDGLAIALADSEDDARKQIIKQCAFEPHNWGTLEVRRPDWRFATYVYGGG